MTNTTYSKAFKEVYVILKSLGKEITDKIPPRFMNLIEENMDKDYIFILDDNTPIEEQNLSNEALGLISLIYRDYIVSDEEREKIKAEEKKRREEVQVELSQKYSYENLFKKNKTTAEEKVEINSNEEMIIAEEKWYTKLINKIKSLFRKS